MFSFEISYLVTRTVVGFATVTKMILGCQYSTTSASNQFKTESGLLQLFIAESLIQNFSFTLPSTKVEFIIEFS